MDFSFRVKAFVKTGKINVYEQVKELILNEKESTDLGAVLKDIAMAHKEKLLAEEWSKISERNRRILINSLFFENWDKLINSFSEITEIEQIKRLEYLGYLQTPEVASFILEQMKSKREGVRLTASSALKKQNPQYLLEPLLVALTKPQEWLPSRVFEVLKFFGPELNKNLYGMVDKVDSQVQEIIVQVLGEIGDKTCLPIFEKLIKLSNGQINKRIAEALKELNIRQSWPILIKLLDEEQWQTRMLAIQCLGRLGIQDTIPILAQRKNLEGDDFLKECINDAIEQIEEANLPIAVSWVREE